MPPKPRANLAYEVAYLSTEATEPKTYREAMASPDAELWKDAMEAEIATLHKAGTYELAELPADRTAIGSRWVYKI